MKILRLLLLSLTLTLASETTEIIKVVQGTGENNGTKVLVEDTEDTKYKKTYINIYLKNSNKCKIQIR